MAESNNFFVFPIKKGCKNPPLIKWRKGSSNKPGFFDRRYPGCNYGIDCGKSGLVVVDLDLYKPKGQNSYLELIMEHGVFPETLTVNTSGGGKHLFFSGSCKSKNNFRPGIDVKSDGGFVVAAGSIVGEGVYKWVDKSIPIADCPEWLLGELSKAEVIKNVNCDDVDLDQDTDILRAKNYLIESAAISVDGDGGQHNSYIVACYCRDMGVSETICLELMLENWNERCEPPWSFDELQKTVRSAYKYAKNHAGNLSASADFESEVVCGDNSVDAAIMELIGSSPVELYDGFNSAGTKGPPELHELNNKYAAVLESGQFVIYSREFNCALERPVWEIYRSTDFCGFYQNRNVETSNGKTEELGKWWLKHPNRNQYSGIVFDPSSDPGKTADGKLNRWRGFAVEAVKGDWSLLRDEIIFKALCESRQDYFDYVLNWIAYMLQNPSKPAEVALVFKGMKGTGKSTLASFLLRIFGAHGISIAREDQLTGKFSGHLRDMVLTVVEEAVWSGSKKAQSVLKDIITSPIITTEAKYLNATASRNMIHMMMLSNEEWVVPATMDERRFGVFEVDPLHIGNFELFAMIYENMDLGGPGAMLYDLLERDISGFHPRWGVPQTKALAAQKMESLGLELLWWHEILDDGCLPFPNDKIDWSCGVEVDRDSVYESYSEFVAARHGRPKPKSVLGKILKDFGWGTIQKWDNENRGKRFWTFSDLKSCINLFDDKMGGNVDGE